MNLLCIPFFKSLYQTSAFRWYVDSYNYLCNNSKQATKARIPNCDLLLNLKIKVRSYKTIVHKITLLSQSFFKVEDVPLIMKKNESSNLLTKYERLFFPFSEVCPSLVTF